MPLREALGRRLATDVASADPVPAFDNSSMDGFAVRAADTSGASPESPATLRVVDESRAGHPAESALGEGEAIGISTGAVIPEGADSVVRVEDTSTGNGRVEIEVEVAPGNDLRHAGDDIEAGAVVLSGEDPPGSGGGRRARVRRRGAGPMRPPPAPRGPDDG